MNIAAKEFIENSLEWTYSKLSDLAKEHGGPEQLIADIYENGYEDGYRDGYSDALEGEQMKRKVIIYAGTTLVVGLGTMVGYFYKKSKSRQKLLEQQMAENKKLKAEQYAKEVLYGEESSKVKSVDGNIVTVDFNKRAQ